MARAEPPHWTPEQFEADRLKALTNFVATWGAEGTKRYEAAVAQFADPLRRLFSRTGDLANLSGDVFVSDASLLGAARFLTAPPISADDLKTLIGGNVGIKKPNLDRARRAAEIVKAAWDPIRFPWLMQKRAPTEQERETAILWTASIWSIESMRTFRRNTSARNQEALVAGELERAGLQRLEARKIDALETLERGSFTRECRLGDHKCDVPVRLHDGRLLAIECKVSNSAVNSKKRLNNDVGAKAADWRRTFGAQVVTAAVLTGVYSLGNLMTAQDHDGVTIFWAHELRPLTDFVQAATE